MGWIDIIYDLIKRIINKFSSKKENKKLLKEKIKNALKNFKIIWEESISKNWGIIKEEELRDLLKKDSINFLQLSVEVYEILKDEWIVDNLKKIVNEINEIIKNPNIKDKAILFWATEGENGGEGFDRINSILKRLEK